MPTSDRCRAHDSGFDQGRSAVHVRGHRRESGDRSAVLVVGLRESRREMVEIVQLRWVDASGREQRLERLLDSLVGEQARPSWDQLLGPCDMFGQGQVLREHQEPQRFAPFDGHDVTVLDLIDRACIADGSSKPARTASAASPIAASWPDVSWSTNRRRTAATCPGAAASSSLRPRLVTTT